MLTTLLDEVTISYGVPTVYQITWYHMPSSPLCKTRKTNRENWGLSSLYS